MTREEFSKALKDVRENSGLGRTKMRMMSRLPKQQIAYMEEASNNYALKNVICYLNTLNFQLFLSIEQRCLVAQDNADVVSFFRGVRESKSITQARLAELSKMATVSLQNIERQQRKFHIDAFLAIASALDIEIKICPIEK